MEATAQVIEQNALSTLERARTIVVSTNEEYVLACQFILGVKALIKEVEGTFGPIKKKAHDTWQETIGKEKAARQPLDEAITIVAPVIIAFEKEQERKRLEEQRRLEEEQRRLDEEARLDEAVALEEQGEGELAERVLTNAPSSAPVVVPRYTPKVGGISTRKSWDFKIIDPAKISRAYMKPDEVKIRAQVKALGPEAVKLVGGIQVFEASTLAGRVR